MNNLLLLLVLLVLVGGGIFLYEQKTAVAPSRSEETQMVPEPERQMAYNCDQNMSVRAVIANRQATITLNDTRTLSLTKTSATHGSRYMNEDETVVFWIEGSGAYVEENGRQTFTHCRSVTAGTPMPKGDEVRIYQDQERGITFYYSALYYLPPQGVESGSTRTRVVIVEDTQENRDLFDGKNTTPREGPIAISLSIYENKNKLSAEEWAKQDKNWEFSTKKLTHAEVGGVAGVSYVWEGLYTGKSTVVVKGERAYVFAVTSTSPQDRILREYDAVLKSVMFSE